MMERKRHRIFKHNISMATAMLILSVLSACQTKTIFHSYQQVDEKGWTRNDTLSYSLSRLSEAGIYNVEIGVRHTEIYPYKDLWLELNYHFLNADKPEKFLCDTIHLYLTDEYGRWKNGGKSGYLYQYTQTCSSVELAKQDSLIIQITHIMKDPHLPGLTDIGIRLFQQHP